jgi:hypothetical protein
MALRGRRTWLWGLGGLALFAGLVYGAARLADEPVRRYMEAEVNRRLSGYVVHIPKLHLHPWSASIELIDSTVVQSSNPDPPVAHVGRLHTRVDLRALLHRRVVADISFERPTIHVDLNNVRAEAADKTALKDRGWQQALEALALDLKINRLRVIEGDVTYVDRGPFRPLHVSHLNVGAENIRNIASREQVYPSPIHLEAVVFDAGSVWLDGRADFLAEPHAGVQAALRMDQVQLDYFTPLIDRYNLSVRKGRLSLAGTVEYAPTITRLILERALVQGVALEYRHLPRTAEAEKARALQTAQVAKEAATTSQAEIRVDQLQIVKSTFGFTNEAASPPYRLELTDTSLTVERLANQRQSGPAVARLTGQLMGRGETRLTAALERRAESADVDVTAQIEDADLVRLKDLVRAYAGIPVAAGEFSMYSELQMRGTALSGYVKPLFRGVQVGHDGEAVADRGLRQRLYEGLIGVGAKVLKNHPRREVATVVPISGRVDRPRLGRWETVGGLVQNAFFKPITPGYEPRPEARGQSPAERSTGPAPDSDPPESP